MSLTALAAQNQFGYAQTGNATVTTSGSGYGNVSNCITTGYTVQCSKCGQYLYNDQWHVCTSIGQMLFDNSEFLRQITTKQLEYQMSYAGNKPLVVCNGSVTECKDLDEAQATAERLAHQSNTDAYILKPIKKVAPKRDVVTTDL